MNFIVILQPPSTSNTLSRFFACIDSYFHPLVSPWTSGFLVCLNLLYSTNQGLETAVPVLLVDGYNVCGYWAKLKKHFMSGRLDIARQKLIDELVAFSLLRGFFFLPFRGARFHRILSVILFWSSSGREKCFFCFCFFAMHLFKLTEFPGDTTTSPSVFIYFVSFHF